MLIQQKVSRTNLPQKFTPASPRAEGGGRRCQQAIWKTQQQVQDQCAESKGRSSPVQCSIYTAAAAPHYELDPKTTELLLT